MKAVASALVEAQKAFGPALKTSTNPHFKSRYADLSACVEAVITALNDAGIALLQITHPDESGVTVETIFLHESGEQISCGKLHVPAAKQDPQGYGSALTYARRYSLMAACGIAPEDDDGNAASKTKPAPKPAPKPSPAPVEDFSDAYHDTVAAISVAETAELLHIATSLKQSNLPVRELNALRDIWTARKESLQPNRESK